MRYFLATMTGLAFAGSALAQTLQFDVNDARFQAYDAEGGPSAFAGVGHTGAIRYWYDGAFTSLNAVSIQNVDQGPFIEQAGFTGVMSDFWMDFQLVNGVVTGGSVMIEVDGGADVYSAAFVAGSGSIEAEARGFTIESLTIDGAFGDADLAGVDISPWFNAQPLPVFLQGDVFSFKFQPDVFGGGYADAEVFVTVPAPAAGATLAAGGLIALRRRRA